MCHFLIVPKQKKICRYLYDVTCSVIKIVCCKKNMLMEPPSKEYKMHQVSDEFSFYDYTKNKCLWCVDHYISIMATLLTIACYLNVIITIIILHMVKHIIENVEFQAIVRKIASIVNITCTEINC